MLVTGTGTEYRVPVWVQQYTGTVPVRYILVLSDVHLLVYLQLTTEAKNK